VGRDKKTVLNWVQWEWEGRTLVVREKFCRVVSCLQTGGRVGGGGGGGGFQIGGTGGEIRLQKDLCGYPHLWVECGA